MIIMIIANNNFNNFIVETRHALSLLSMNTLKPLGDNPPHNYVELRLPAVKTPTINSSKPFADITPNYYEELKLLLQDECCGQCPPYTGINIGKLFCILHFLILV